MPEKTQKRKLRRDPPSDHHLKKTTSSIVEENPSLTDRDFEDITNKLENRTSKRLRDTQHSQREILRLIENLSSKVDSLSSVSLEQGSSNSSQEDSTNSLSSENNILNGTSNAGHNIWNYNWLKLRPTEILNFSSKCGLT